MYKKVLVIDASSAVTGAFKSAIYTAKALGGARNVLFAVPFGSEVISLLDKEDYDFIELRMFGIRKSFFSLVLYLPFMIIDTIRVRLYINNNKIEVIIVNDYDNLIGCCLKILGWRGRLYTFVRRIPSSQMALLARFWLRSAFRFSDRVLGVSSAVVREFPESKKSIRLYNAIDIKRHYENAEFPEGSFSKFVCIGNYMHDKGQGDVLEAFHQAYLLNSNIKIDFYGGDLGRKKNRKYKSFLKCRAEDLGISHLASFHDFSSDVEEIMVNSHVVLSCGYAESFSRVCVEAGWFQRPVIATKCGGPEEIIEHNVTGILVGVGDVESIANAIVHMAESSKRCEVMGLKARDRVVEKFSYDVFETSLRKIIDMRPLNKTVM